MLQVATGSLSDQEVSPDLWQDAMLLSHLARSIMSYACAAATAGGIAVQDIPADCNVTRASMARHGDADTFATLSRLYRRVAAAIGRDDLAAVDLSGMTPVGAVTAALDLVGQITGNVPTIRMTGVTETVPLFQRYLTSGPGLPAASPKRAWVAPVLGGAAALLLGGVVGWLAAGR